MNITINPDLQERIQEKIRSGEFESADALVEQALTFFLEFEEGRMDGEEFRDAAAAIDQALGQAERGEGISLEEFDRRMRSKYGIAR